MSHLTSCLEPDEIVTRGALPRHRRRGWGSGFAEVAPRHGDYAVCAVACALRVEDGVVAEARLGAARGLRPAGAPARRRPRRWWARAASPRRSPRRPARRAPRSSRATACTPRPSTGGTSPACSRAAAPERRLRDGGDDERARRSPSTAGACREHVDDRLLLVRLPAPLARPARHARRLRARRVRRLHGAGSTARAVRSCLMLAAQAEGCHVETVEALAEPEGPLSALQDAFRRHHALQCGFCTPGHPHERGRAAGRRRGADPRARSRSCSPGHLCRCTGYEPIVDAIAEVAGSRRVNLGEHLLACAERHPEARRDRRRRAARDLRRAARARTRAAAGGLRELGVAPRRPRRRGAQEPHRDGRPLLGVAVARRRLRAAQLAPAARRADLLRGRLRRARPGDRGRFCRGRRGRRPARR